MCPEWWTCDILLGAKLLYAVKSCRILNNNYYHQLLSKHSVFRTPYLVLVLLFMLVVVDLLAPSQFELGGIRLSRDSSHCDHSLS